ncbi:MAG: serine hydrolase [Hyphomicrobiaceae bacterium]
MIATVRKAFSSCLPLIAILAVANTAVTPAHAGGAHALFIMDANTGATLTEQSGNEQRYPASLTKMMTLYLAFDAIEHGRASMKTKIKISQTAANAAPSKLDLAPGDEISLEDAILALITKSANDVAIAIAEHLGGTEANFAKLMTAKAREIGMKSTTFQNASGLPNSSQHTTARDMTTLGVRLYDDFPRYFPLFSTRSHNYNGSNFRNHNTLMLQMPGINGIKTGYTHASGFNLVSSLQLDGKHVIGAIFGGESAGSRNAQMRVALTRAMAKASTVKTRKPVLVARAEAKAAGEAKKPKPAPVQVAAAPAPQPVAKPQPAAKPPSIPASDVPAAPAAVAVNAPQTALKIDVAKVRSIDHANAVPQPPQQTSAPGSKPAHFAQASAAPNLADAIKSRVAPQAASASAPAKTVRQPSSFENQMAGLAQNIQPAEAPSASAPQPVALPVEPARPPSSLGAQLAALTQSAPAAMAQPYRLKGPDAPVQATSPAPTGKGFEIQVGAYASAAEADRQLSQVQTQSPILAGYTPKRHTVKLGDKMLYRARFSGFDQSSAQAVCAELIRDKINCLALKAD